MPVWYILRDGQQIGPFTSQALLSMLARGGLYAQDQFLDASTGKSYTIEKAIRQWQKTPGLRPRKRHTGLIVFAVIVLLIGGFIGYKILTKTSDKLTLDGATTVSSGTVSAAGGSITVIGGELEGFSVDVPEGAFEQDTHFKVSTRPIKSHKFGALFTPVTPLITVNNGHVFAKESLTVTIPIQKTDDEFAMGFYYDEKTGELEGIPIVSEDNRQITLLTNHFSDIVVSTVKLSDLTNISVDTGFYPGVDDWQFTNYGSFIAQGGHCAGQSITAMWYYQEMVGGSHYPRLNGEFDNYDYSASTKDFWFDDSCAYRFASVIQETIAWDALAYKTQKKLANATPSQTMAAFIYAMIMTGEPQFVEIWGKRTTPDGNQSDAGHAIIAYAVENGCIYVADPNYPGADDRYIQFTGSAFDTYSSGTNAAAIEAGYDIPFTDIYYIGQSSLIDYSVIDDQYERMISKTVGDDMFPKYTLKLLKSIDKNGNEKWVDCPEELKVESAENVENLGDYFRDKIRIGAACQNSGVTVTLYLGLNDAKAVAKTVSNGSGWAQFDIQLEPGINDLGFYMSYVDPDGYDHYIDFTRVMAIYDLSAEMRFDQDPYNVVCKSAADYTVTVRNAPADVKYVWDFGDGGTAETEEPAATYAYEAAGDYTITCTLINAPDGKVLAEARAAVEAVDVFGAWNMSYTITEAGAVNYIANFFGDMILGVIQQIFPDQGVPDSANINIEGTVVYARLDVYQPESGYPEDGRIYVELIQLSSSTDFIEVSTTPIPGYLKVDKGKITVVLTGDSAEGGSTGAMTFKGTLSNGVISGTFTASGVMSGDFEAKK